MEQHKQQRPTPAVERGRWSSPRKLEVFLRVLRGEDVDALSRELGVTTGAIAAWRDQVLAAGQTAVRSRPADERDEEIARLRAKVGRADDGQRAAAAGQCPIPWPPSIAHAVAWAPSG